MTMDTQTDVTTEFDHAEREAGDRILSDAPPIGVAGLGRRVSEQVGRPGMRPDLTGHLRTLGIPEDAARVYQSLLEHGAQQASTIARALDCRLDVVCAAVDELSAVGLISTDGTDDVTVLPVDPVAALENRRAALEAGVAASINASIAAYEFHRRNHSDLRHESGVEVIHGSEIHRTVAGLERAALHHVRAFDTAPYEDDRVENPIEIDNLRRGVRYRILYARASIETPDFYAGNIVPCIDAGEVARCAPSVPTKMFLMDDRVAMVGLTAADADSRHTALRIRSASLLKALSDLFELRWDAGLPLSVSSEGRETELKPIETLLLRQLAIGATDDVVAHNLRISRRTVARYIERLMRISGAKTRFQLATYAVQRSWVGSPSASST